MTDSAPLNILLVLAFLASELAGLMLVGEMAGRALAQFSFWKAGLPEWALLTGYAAFSLTASAAFPFTISAKGLFPAVALVTLGLWVYSPPASSHAPDWTQPYLVFRRSRGFLFAAGGLVLFSALVAGYRMPWLVHLSLPAKVIAGTNIFDDARTIGMPISLAAYGFPLHSPLNVGARVVYPIGAFLFSAGLIAWIPFLPLAILIADIATQALFYSATVLFLAGLLFRSRLARTVLLLSATCAVAINLYILFPKLKSSWIPMSYTTIGWAPYSGLIWIPNHALGFCSMLLAGFWLTREPSPRYFGIPLLFAAFSAVSSMDMTVLSLAAAGFLMLTQLVRGPRKFFREPLNRAVILIALTAFLLLVWINFPTLHGEVDSPYDRAFPINTRPKYNLGMLASHSGLFLVLLLIGSVVLRGAGFPFPWLIVISTAYVFAMAFQYHSIWFWRVTFAANVLLGLAAAWQLERMSSAAKRWIFPLWALVMIPGLYQMLFDFRGSAYYGAWTSPQRAQALSWIDRNTPLWARVVEYRSQEASLAADPSFLRTGNRGGELVSDRVYPIVGYREYVDRMKDVVGALASNDFILVPKEAASLGKLLAECSPPRFSTRDESVYEITPACRDFLVQPQTHRSADDVQRLFHIEAIVRRIGPETLSLAELAEYVGSHPDQAFHIRHRADKLWGEGKFDELLQALGPVADRNLHIAEVNYVYAFTLHISRRDPRRAIEFYTRALNDGYDKFWVLYNRGAAYLLLRLYAPAKADLTAARALNPKHEGVQQLLKELAGR